MCGHKSFFVYGLIHSLFDNCEWIFCCNRLQQIPNGPISDQNCFMVIAKAVQSNYMPDTTRILDFPFTHKKLYKYSTQMSNMYFSLL